MADRFHAPRGTSDVLPADAAARERVERTARELFERDVNLRIGFRFLHDLLGKFNHDTQMALLAYNRGPGKVSQILAQGGDPANGYSDAVLEGYHPPKAEVGWR